MTTGTRTSPHHLARTLATSRPPVVPEASLSTERHVPERRAPVRRPSFGQCASLASAGAPRPQAENENWAAGHDRDLMAELRDIPVPPEPMLHRVFDLTPAEARLARKLARGDSLEQVAQALDVKMTTARSQLAAIFAKTGTCRQAQLVAILSRLAHLA